VAEYAYHHGRLREALLEAAVVAVREEGPQGLGIRSLARRVGVSHSAAYRHFADRDDLVAEVAGQVMEQLVEAILVRLNKVRTQEPVLRARQRLAASGRAYVDYAVSEPALFRLAFNSLSAAGTEPSNPERNPLRLLGQVLDELVEAGFLDPDARTGAELTCCSAMHGFSVLAIDGPLQGASDAECTTALDRVLVAIDRSYGATTGTRTNPKDIT
jgi:AcrR family transcriptional regulator